jgi:restriction system protein
LAAVLARQAAAAGAAAGPEGEAAADAAGPAAEGAAQEAPLCPKCGKVMVVRIGRREGPHFGERCWGCPSFPRCRGVREAIGG